MMRGIRGATTAQKNDEKSILLETRELLKQMMLSNQLDPENVASVFISATADLTAAFPAKALREFNDWKYVPVMCMQELNVPGGLERCIRVMIHYNTTTRQQEIQHIYLNDAVSLRPDLLGK
ncbi:chorismate mutase [Rossellomorea aquimaris]|uniref:chorismate mutase n=1 Tax=Rossellomorea aquimaris TaxID=189382 RepID=UPI001CD63B4F|nr:chorismate mutase [Rossellomorea aquimaris]MCA1054636.1 chorismate mutase [Rossellomorea aquimaris]